MGNLVDMARTESDKTEQSPLVQENKYPYGLQINLDDEGLSKLDVDISDWEVGDVFPLDILVKLTGKSCNEFEGGNQRCSVSLQITHIGAEEHEDTPEKESESEEPSLEKHGYLRYGA